MSLSDGVLCFTRQNGPVRPPTVLCSAFAASPPLAVSHTEQKPKKD